MSEFSENHHLRSERAEDAAELLRLLKRKGYVYQPVNGWVSFVAEGGAFEPDEKIVSAARQPLLHFVSAEDHGWSFTLFDRGKVVCHYSCAWENDIATDDSGYSREALERLVPSVESESLDEFERRMHPTDFDELLEGNTSRMLAQALGVEHYEWLAYDYLASDSPEDHPDATEVT